MPAMQARWLLKRSPVLKSDDITSGTGTIDGHPACLLAFCSQWFNFELSLEKELSNTCIFSPHCSLELEEVINCLESLLGSLTFSVKF